MMMHKFINFALVIFVVLLAVAAAHFPRRPKRKKYPRMRIHLHTEERHRIIGEWPRVEHHDPRGA